MRRHAPRTHAIIAQHIDAIYLHQVNAELAQIGLQRRLGWLIENTVEAAERVGSSAPRRLAANYRGARVILGNSLGLGRSEQQTLPDDPRHGIDFLDRNIGSERSQADVIATSSRISKRWRIATSIQPDDFEAKLRAAHDVR